MIKDYPPYLDYPKPRKPMTNADKLRSMTDKELAEFLMTQQMKLLRKVSELFDFPLLINEEQEGSMWLDWLRQEARE